MTMREINKMQVHMNKNIEKLKQTAMDAAEIESNRFSAIDKLGELSQTDNKAINALFEIAENSPFDKEKRRAISYLLKYSREKFFELKRNKD